MYTIQSYEDLSESTILLRNQIQVAADINFHQKYRISLLAEAPEDINNFIYEPYIEYPQTTKVVTGEQVLKKYTKNIAHFTTVENFNIVNGAVDITEKTASFTAKFYFDTITLKAGTYTFSFKTNAQSPNYSNQNLYGIKENNDVINIGTISFIASGIDIGIITIEEAITLKGLRV